MSKVKSPKKKVSKGKLPILPNLTPSVEPLKAPTDASKDKGSKSTLNPSEAVSSEARGVRTDPIANPVNPKWQRLEEAKQKKTDAANWASSGKRSIMLAVEVTPTQFEHLYKMAYESYKYEPLASNEDPKYAVRHACAKVLEDWMKRMIPHLPPNAPMIAGEIPDWWLKRSRATGIE